MTLGAPIALVGCLAVVNALLPAAPIRAGTLPQTDALPPSAETILRAAFTNRYEVDTISSLELTMRNRAGQERRRRFDTVSKLIDGKLHSIGRLVAPERLRGMTIMIVERGDRAHDSFVFLPSLGRVRRISTAQRGDAFLGSDLTYEDFERQYVEDYQLAHRAAEVVQGEPAYVIRGHPHHRHSYEHVDFLVAKADGAILGTRYYKANAEEPHRVIVVPREAMQEGAGHLLPTYLKVENAVRGTTTEVKIENLSIAPEIDERVFTLRTLEQERRLPQATD